MSCKYCFQSDHTIEQCKTILCRVCKEIGHPHWLCTKDKKSIKKVSSKPISSSKTSITPSFSEKVSVSNFMENSNPSTQSDSRRISKSISPIISKDGSKPIVSLNIPETKRDIQFYLKQSGRKWSDIL